MSKSLITQNPKPKTDKWKNEYEEKIEELNFINGWLNIK